MAEEAMIAYLPHGNLSWMQQSLPHMTLVYAGKTADLRPTDFNSLAKDALSAARITRSFNLPVTEIRQLGDNKDLNGKVDALILYPTPQLLLARQLVESWNKSSFKDFLPHVTIGPEGSAQGALPSELYFGKIGAFWNDQQILFDLDMLY